MSGEAEVHMNLEVYDEYSGYPADFRWVVEQNPDAPDAGVLIQYEDKGEEGWAKRGEPICIGKKGAVALADALRTLVEFMDK